MSDTC